ncbi:MAG: N-acetylneuraminate synthase family protein [Deltaproteobacteria bacterium]|nr:N-acetylneuraminate synthase family protein [Deltaproteobacteria bacterium]
MKILDLFKTFGSLSSSLVQPYIIAEVGVNHEGSMDMAKRLIDEACAGGADAVKFQAYKADTLASINSPAYWDLTKEKTESQYELFKRHDRFWKKEFEELKSHCDAASIEFMCTPFDLESAGFLNDLVSVFKISSSDITNKPFIEYICGFGKPVILSTGASHLSEIKEAVEWIERSGTPLALLHCVLNYPTAYKDANLGMILDLRNKFPDKIIGYSDHTLPGDMKILEIAVLLGAIILEKHFTLDKNLPGNDHYHAMDKDDLQKFRKNLEDVFNMLGSFTVSSLESEEPARRNARRSLVARRSIPQNKVLEPDDLTWKRPGTGISPLYMEQVIGQKVLIKIEKDALLEWSFLYRERPDD